MALGFKLLAALIAVTGTIAFPYLLFLNSSFKALYWNLIGQDIIYASIGVIVTYAFIIALASLLWNKA